MRLRHVTGVVTLVGTIALLAPAASLGAVVRVTPEGVLTYVAAAGEANDVSVAFDNGDFVFTETGPGVTLTSPEGCTATATANQYSCSQPIFGFTGASMKLGDQNDTFSDSSSLPWSSVHGGPGNDNLSPGGNGYRIFGDAGDDAIDSGVVVDGGPGADTFTNVRTVDYHTRTAHVSVTINGVADDGAQLEGDNVVSATGAIGGNGPDTLDFSQAAGGATLDGLAGDDTLIAGPQGSYLRGGFGDDTLTGGAGFDTLDGGAGADTMTGGASQDTADYRSSTDGIRVSLDGVRNDGEPGEGDNVAVDVENVSGGEGNDVLVGNGAANRLTGGFGNDRLDGGGGNDYLLGDALTSPPSAAPCACPSNDTLIGGPGNDYLFGTDGNDLLDGGNGTDLLDGGTGIDTVTYASATGTVFVSLDQVANDGPAGQDDNVYETVENVTTGSGNDTIYGSAKANVLKGGAGNDRIFGGGGPDSITGGPGVDSLFGGTGDDTIFARDTTADATIDGGANRTATPGDRAQIDTALDGPNTTHVETFLP